MGLRKLLHAIALLVGAGFIQCVSAEVVADLELGLIPKGVTHGPANAIRAKMAEELDLGTRDGLIAKGCSSCGSSTGGGHRSTSRTRRRGGGGIDATSHFIAQRDLHRHTAAEAADQADTDKQMAEAEEMIRDAEAGLGPSRRTHPSRPTAPVPTVPIPQTTTAVQVPDPAAPPPLTPVHRQEETDRHEGTVGDVSPPH